ncbi:MAG: type II secretion system protein, partial [Limisphaerales bacterium]
METKTTQAFTLIELLVVICILFVLAAMIPCSFSSAKPRAQRIHCVNNQKQIGTAYRIWAGDNGDKLPAQVLNTTTNAGWAEFATMTNAGPYCWSNYCLMQNELGQSPKVLVCPSDTRSAANNFTKFSNKNISYFMNPGANENFPLSILGGDRNLAPGLKPENDFGFSPDDGSGNDVILQTNSPVCWSLKMHSAGNPVGAGNILVGDGSV